MLRRHWISPPALAFAQTAHAFSWLLIFWAAWSGNFQNPMYGFAWIHTVALAWITTAALAILIFALPNFIESTWRAETVARGSIAVFAAGAALLVAGFLRYPQLLGTAGCVVLAALLVYLATAVPTLAGAAPERVERAVARAFGVTFLFLLVTALLGFGLAWILSGHPVWSWLPQSAPAHANLGTLGWLSMLIFGVSMNTRRPITGVDTRMRWMHIVFNSLAVIGIPLLAAGTAAHIAALAWVGGALFALAALSYAIDTWDMLSRARVRHRPPQAFIFASVSWLLVAMVLGAFVLAGEGSPGAYAFVLLVGWAGQMVNAHIYHIGIRLLATVYRGEDDETRPGELLEARLSWFSFGAFQIAIALVLVALLKDNAGLAARGAIFGIGGWIAMAANIVVAAVRARSGPVTLKL